MFPLVGAQENAVDQEGVFVFRLAERRRALRNVEARDNLDVAKSIRAPCQRFLQDERHGGAALAANGIAAFYEADGLVGSHVVHGRLLLGRCEACIEGFDIGVHDVFALASEDTADTVAELVGIEDVEHGGGSAQQHHVGAAR